MSQKMTIYGDYLKPQELHNILQLIKSGGVILLPTDTGYSLICRLGDKQAAQKIRQMKAVNKDYLFTIFCQNLSELSFYGKVDNAQYRLLKPLVPGLFTCILLASKAAPKLLQHEKRKTVGIRVPDGEILPSILREHGEALMGVSVFPSSEVIADLGTLEKSLLNRLDLIVDAGERPNLLPSIIDFTDMPPVVISAGAGDLKKIFP